MEQDEETGYPQGTGEAGIVAGPGELQARIRAHDWSRTPVGPVEQWPRSLKALVKMLLASRYPMVLTWGPSFIQFYNDAYSELIGDKHPAALGIDIRITLAEAWDTLGPMIETVMATGTPSWVPALRLLLERAGYREESYFSVSHGPAEDDEGRIVGMLGVCSEVTQQVLGERRLRLLRDLASRTSEIRQVGQTCRDLAAGLATNPLDIPFALLYLRAPDGHSLDLCCAVGVAEGEPASPRTVSLEAGEQSPWPLAQVAQGETRVIDDVDRIFTVHGGPWGDPVRSALVLPVASAGHEAPLGVLVVGLSPNRALDEGYRSFCELLATQVSVALRNARAYEDERKRAETLAALDRAKTAFFSNVSHEFRTPITLILGPVEDSLADTDEPLPGPQRQRIELVRRNALRLLKLVNTLLDFARVEAGRARAMFEPTDLAALTTSLVSLFESTIRRAGLQLTVDIPPSPEQVYVDRTSWEKIVLNLLSNAVKFTLTGGITVSQHVHSDHVRLTVRDTGIGIPADQLVHVFERFHRIEGAAARSHEGSGIGLALVQELVRMHGGQISVDSSLGSGAVFTVELPLGAAHLEPGAVGIPAVTLPPEQIATPFLEEALRWLPGESAAGERPHDATDNATDIDADDRARSREPTPATGQPAIPAAAERFRILLVDDNPDLRAYVRDLLEPRYAVTTATNGRVALAAIERERPDLILSDVMMPELNGFELLHRLRSDPATRDIPFIMLSARAGEGSASEGLEAGADDYLVKPFAARELLARVGTHLALTRMRAETVRLRNEVEHERELAARELAARHLAEEASRLKDEFLATVSHELRTPLMAINGWVSMLKAGQASNPAVLSRALEVIDRNVKAQTRIVSDVLDMSRLVTGKLRIDPEPVSLEMLALEAIEVARTPAAAKGIALRFEPPDEPCLVPGDTERLRQILWNLLSNAVKFTSEGGRVSLALRAESSAILIEVSDTGMGIAPEFLPHVFDHFRQADGSTTRRHGGLGLGLTLVKHLVELHGGQISAASEGPGKGATFTVRLPNGMTSPMANAMTSPPGAQQDGQASTHASKAHAQENTPGVATPDPALTRAQLAGTRVLLVEDEPDARELLEAVLSAAGAHVRTAASAAEGFAALPVFRPHVLVSDLGLPDRDGLSLLREVRALEDELRNVPAIAVTAFAGRYHQDRAMQAGFQHYLTKPIAPEILVETVATMVGRT